MIQQIQEKARELLQSGKVACVIGYERATDGVGARPAFIYKAEDAGRLIFDQTCVHNLAKYLIDKKDKPAAIVVKGCDSRAVNLLLSEKQIERDKVFVIGAVCPGVFEWGWNRTDKKLQGQCETCRAHTPVIYDYLVGEPVQEPPPPADRYAEEAALEAKPDVERAEFWRKQSEACIRCYACRRVCPGCYCYDCFVENLDPEWVGIRVAPPQNQMWLTIRAYHLAGRCVDCHECDRVCPVGIPLKLLNHKLEKEVQDTFGYCSGMSPEAVAPLITFKKDEEIEV